MKQWQSNGVSLEEGMRKFIKWYDPDLAFTCWGLNFDEPIINSNLIAIGESIKWKYWASRCARTICELEGVKIKRSQKSHNALQDCKDQCNALFEVFKSE